MPAPKGFCRCGARKSWRWRTTIPRLNLETEEGKEIPPDERPFVRVARDGEAISGQVVYIHRANGTLLPVLINVAPFSAPDLSRGMIGVLTEISALVEMSKKRDDLMRMISHDLRTPLTAIIGYADLLKMRLSQPSPGVEEALDALSRSSRLMLDMLKELNDMNRLETRETGIRERLRLDLFLPVLLDDLSPSHEMGRVQTDIADGLPPVCGDRDQVSRIVINLLGNALKYSPPDSPVRIEMRRAGRQVRLSISDQGEGIDFEDQARLFDRYFRAGRPREDDGGLGLGLYITRLLVEANGGRIYIASLPGKGAPSPSICRQNEPGRGQLAKPQNDDKFLKSR